MSNNFYNEEESQFQELRAVLKELPKIKAEDNFEYNLMTRIHNKQFDSKLLKREKYSLFGFLKPAIAVGAAATLVFVITQNQTTEVENPFAAIPEVRSEVAENGSSVSTPKEFVVADNMNKPAENYASESVEGVIQTRRLILQDNDVITVAQEDFPFPDRSFNLDARMRSVDATTARDNSSRVLAGTGDPNRIYFEGFFTGNQSAKKTIDSLRNKSFRNSLNKKLQIE